jgi:CheY-like chemotaxis protein/GAF domain-containing protein
MAAMAPRPKILLFSRRLDRVSALAEQLDGRFDVVSSESVEKGLEQVREGNFSVVFLCGDETSPASAMIQGGGLLDQLPDGYALLDTNERVVWCNASLLKLAGRESGGEGVPFFDLFESAQLRGPDFTPINTALASNQTTCGLMQVGGSRWLDLRMTPVFESEPDCPFGLIAFVRDVTLEVNEQERMQAIYQAGLELGDLTPQEVLEMGWEERKELLKAKILHFTKDLLKFETVEIRLFDHANKKRLVPLLVYGMEQAAVERELFAEPTGNGVTGYVAATGNSYLCLDTAHDPLYLVGNSNARSSLTVPLKRHNGILGTFNVESSQENAFNEKDQEFLELFSREVAVAINTLELLVVQQSVAANQNTTRILLSVAQPADDILVDASQLMERFIGLDPESTIRLQRILQHTREIKQLIHEVGLGAAASGALPIVTAPQAHPLLNGKRILVVDNDASVRDAARELLGQFGCDVEAFHCGQEAFTLVRGTHYDLAIIDINLSDMTGFECFRELKQIHENLPIILMTGFGYDPGHSIVKARQMGLKHALYKPFRLDLLLTAVEGALSPPTESKPSVTRT